MYLLNIILTDTFLFCFHIIIPLLIVMYGKSMKIYNNSFKHYITDFFIDLKFKNLYLYLFIYKLCLLPKSNKKQTCSLENSNP